MTNVREGDRIRSLYGTAVRDVVAVKDGHVYVSFVNRQGVIKGDVLPLEAVERHWEVVKR